jgi:hypothetical protein
VALNEVYSRLPLGLVGRVKWKIEPLPTALVAQMRPPCWETMLRQMARPRPVPDDLRFTQMLPKTRSGKIMRRLLRELATTGDVKGDTTTLEDFGVLAKLREGDE